MDSGPEGLYRDALFAVRELVSDIGDGDLARPTPCTDWDLRALAGHMVGQNRGFAAAIAAGDAAAGDYAPRPIGDAAGLRRAWDESVDLLLGACATAEPDRPVRLVEISTDARFPAAAAVRIQLLDTVVHTWDVATSLGLVHRPGPDVLDLVASVARRIPDGPSRTAAGATFRPSLDLATADPWAATLGHLGRQPHP